MVVPTCRQTSRLACRWAADHACRRALHPLQLGHPGGGGWLVPITANTGTFEHMVVVREPACAIEACQPINPNGFFVAAIIHIDNERMPGGNNKHGMRNLFNCVRNATQVQLAADGLDWILFWERSMFGTLSDGKPGMRDGPGGPIISNPGTPGDMHSVVRSQPVKKRQRAVSTERGQHKLENFGHVCGKFLVYAGEGDGQMPADVDNGGSD